MITTSRTNMQPKTRTTVLATAGFTLVLLAATVFATVPAFSAGQCPPNCINEGRMTGGGVIRTINQADGQAVEVQVTHGFTLHCDVADKPNNLQVNWNKGNKFHLESYEFAGCEDQPTIEPNPPDANFDTLVANGFGRLNGESGAFIFIIFADAGEPGTNDTATIVIIDSSGNVVLDITDNLDGGNHQAHKENK